MKRFKLMVFVVALGGAVAISLAAGSRPASADACQNFDRYNLPCRTGFFKGQSQLVGNDVIKNGVPPDVVDAPSFIGFIQNRLGCVGNAIPAPLYDTQDSTGAAFIIATMLGYRPGIDKNVACREFGRWTALVYEYDRGGQVIWKNNMVDWYGNSFYLTNSSDDGYIGTGDHSSGSDDVIAFRNKGGGTYYIRRPCANPVNEFTPLVTPPPSGNPQSPPPGSAGAIQVSCDTDLTGKVRDSDSFLSIPVRATFTDTGGHYSQNLGAAPQNDPAHVNDPNYYWPISPPISRPAWMVNGVTPWRVIVEAQNRQDGRWVTVADISGAPCLQPVADCVPGPNVPATIDPNGKFDVSGGVIYHDALNKHTAQQAAQAVVDNSGAGFHGFVKIVDSNGNTIINKPATNSAPYNGVITVSAKQIGPVNDTGQVGFFWGVTGSPISNANIMCPRSTVVPGQPGGGGTVIESVLSPVFSVEGGDISAGGAMAPAGISGAAPDANGCSSKDAEKQNDNAGIVSWNNGATAFDGAGTDYAALALGRIQDVATAQGKTGLQPNGLAFANATQSAPGATPSSTYKAAGDPYGGDYGTACMPNRFDNTKIKASGQYLVNGPGNAKLVLSKDGAPGTTKDQDTIFIDGDAYITNDIIFAKSGAYASTTDIPRFTLVVLGNIYIGKDVTNIDGVLVAQPKKGKTDSGIIYTCAPSGFTTTALSVLNKNLFRDCNNQLTINGAVLAKQIWLLRTAGTATPPPGGATVPAEKFNFTPEAWLDQPFTSDLTGKVGSYDAISTLPPVL